MNKEAEEVAENCGLEQITWPSALVAVPRVQLVHCEAPRPENVPAFSDNIARRSGEMSASERRCQQHRIEAMQEVEIAYREGSARTDAAPAWAHTGPNRRGRRRLFQRRALRCRARTERSKQHGAAADENAERVRKTSNTAREPGNPE